MHVPKQAKALKIGVPFKIDHDIGLGDVIKFATSKFGIEPCMPCEQRAANLNERVIFKARP